MTNRRGRLGRTTPVAGFRLQPDIIDKIYECSLRPDVWPEVLDSLSAIVSGRGGVLFVARSRIFNWTTSQKLSDIFQAYFEEGWLARCTRKTCMLSKSTPGFIVEEDIWHDDELDANPTYRDFLRPRGLGWSAGTAMRMPTGDDLVFSLERDYERGPIERSRVKRLDRLRPHLGRSAFIAARLQFERAKSASDALGALGLPALVMDSGGKVQAANALIDDVSPSIEWRAAGHVALGDRHAQELLDTALASVDAQAGAAALSLPIRDGDGAACHVLHLIPVRRSVRDVFAKSSVMLVFTPVAHPKVPSIDLMRSLFDLTAAEARIARAIGTGQSIQEVAAHQSVSANTVRYHLRRLFEKTGCKRQADLVALLSNLFSIGS